MVGLLPREAGDAHITCIVLMIVITGDSGDQRVVRLFRVIPVNRVVRRIPDALLALPQNHQSEYKGRQTHYSH